MADTFNPYHEWLGIPPAEQPADYYRLLGVSRFEPDAKVISNAADARMVYVRTFQSSQRSAISQRILNELGTAKICLLDPQKKAAYDRQLQARMAKIAEASQLTAASHPPGAGSQPIATTRPSNAGQPVVGLQPLGPVQPTAARPLPQAKPLTAQALPSTPVDKRSVNNPQSPAPTNPLASAAPAFFNPNVTTATKGKQGKKTPAWLIPSMIGGGVFLAGLLVLVGVLASGAFSPKREMAKATNATASPVPTSSTTPPPTPANTSDVPNSPETSPTTTKADTPATPPATATPPVNPFDPPAITPPSSTAPSTPPENPFFPENNASKRPPVNPFDPPATASPQTPPQVLPERSGNLLGLVAPSKMTYDGNVTVKNGEATIIPTGGRHTHLIVPYSTPEEYDLITKVLRESSVEGLAIGFCMGGALGSVHVDAWPNFTGITKIDNRSYNDPSYPAKVFRGTLLKTGIPATIVVHVRRRSVTIVVDDKEVFTWEGTPNLLSLDKDYQRPPQTLSLHVWQARFRITHLEVQPVAPTPSTAVAVVPSTNTPLPPNPNPFFPEGASTTTATEPRTSLGDIKKPKAPDEATYAKKQEEVRSIFGDEIKKAKKPEDKAAAAQRLMDGARKLLDDPDARYVMLDEARILAAEGSHLSMALLTIDLLTQTYDFNVASMKLDTYKKASGGGSTIEQRRQIMDLLLQLATSAAEDGHIDVATEATEAMIDLAKRGKVAEVVKAGAEMKADLARRKKAWDEIRQAEKQLATDPDDAEANLKVGRFYCFTRNDWAHGLKHLAKGGDDDLAKAAKLERDAAGMATGAADIQFAAGAAWEKAAESLSKADKPSAQRRATRLYSAAMPSLTGLNKIRAQQKLDALSDQLAFTGDIHLPIKITQAGISADVYAGMIGRVLVGAKDAGILVRYTPGRRIRAEKLNNLVQETKAPNVAALTFQLVGVLPVTQDTWLHTNQRYDDKWSGGMRLLLDRKELLTIKSDGSSGDKWKALPIKKGDHEMGWEIGGEVGNCELSIRVDNSTGSPPSTYYTKDQLETLRRKLVKSGKPKEIDLCD